MMEHFKKALHLKHGPALLRGLFCLLLPFVSSAHQGKHQSESQSKLAEENKLTEINELYVERIKPIFEKKCFDCHSNETTYPWYYKLPGAKQLIDSDVEEAKKHLDMSKDFPFLGHGSPQEDLDAIEKVAKENSMPPFRYSIVNWDKGLNQDDRKMIREWTGTSIKLLQEATKPSENSNQREKRDTKK